MAKMVERDISVEDVCRACKFSKTAYYIKINGQSEFHQSKITAIKKLLNLDLETTGRVFNLQPILQLRKSILTARLPRWQIDGLRRMSDQTNWTVSAILRELVSGYLADHGITEATAKPIDGQCKMDV